MLYVITPNEGRPPSKFSAEIGLEIYVFLNRTDGLM